MADLQIGLSNFRAFAETGTISVYPLTILVGENSTGKTSFLAALRYCFNLSEPGKGGFFNSYPFDLGSYEDIVHQSSSPTTRHRFSFTIEKEVDIARGGIVRIDMGDEADIRRCKLKLFFCSKYGEVSLSSLTFGFDDLVLSYTSGSTDSIQIVHSGRQIEIPVRERSFFNRDSVSGFDDLRSLSYRIYDHTFAWTHKEPKKGRRDAESMQRVAQAFDAFVSSSYILHTSPPVRSVPKRVYTSSDESGFSDQTHAPHELNRLKRADRRRWGRLNTGLTRFGRLSGLFTRFDITKLTKQDAGPFQLKVTVRGRPSNIADVGYGVSQSLPILTDLVESTSDRSVFLFQQPEVHLHPRAQAAMGTTFSDFIQSRQKSYLIAETHSDFLVDRIRTEIRDGRLSCELFAILFFEAKGQDVKIHEITVDKLGNLIGAPASYKEFFIAEQEKVLGI